MQYVPLDERIEVDCYKGVTKFSGEINGQSGQWVGIDWDDPGRGKHNGCVNDVQYFVARAKTTGSFVRPDALNFGTDLLKEIVDKYVNDSSENSLRKAAKDADCSRWELVEMNKIYKQQSNIQELKCIVLSNRLVSYVNSKQSSVSFHCCSELDLSNALIGRWSKLVEILRLFPVLQTLHLSRNRMEPLENVDLSTLVVSSPIAQFSMSNCFLSEETANLITKLFINLKEIYLAFNELTSYSPLGHVSKLQKIDLQGNKISEFSQIFKIAALPSLEFLNLSNCELKNIEFPSNFNDIGYSQLSTLFIQHNPALDKWSFIHELSRLPALKKLVLRGVLLPGSKGMDSREMIIAKMPKLIDLDRCDISPLARRSSELLFLNRFGQTKPIDPDHQETIKRLEKVYGAANNEGDVDPQKLAKENISGIQSKKIHLIYDGKDIQKDLSLLLSIHKIVGLASKLFDFDPTDISAVELKRKNYPAEQLKRTRDNRLGQFNLEDGDGIAFVPY